MSDSARLDASRLPPPTVPRLPQARVPAADAPPPEKLLGLAVGVVVIAALYFGREVLIPITLAILLSFVLAPLVGGLRRLHVPRAASVLLAAAAALGVIVVLAGLIGSQVATLAFNLPSYQTTIETKVGSVSRFMSGDLDRLVHRFERGVPAPAAETPAVKARPGERAPQPVTVVQPPPSSLVLARSVLGPLLSPLAECGIVLVVTIFVLLQREDLRDRLIRLFGSNDLLRTTAALDDAARRLGRYFLMQLGVNASFGVLITIGLAVIGVPSPVLWGITGALLRFVPYVGSFIAALLPSVLAAAVAPGWGMVIETIALFVVTEGLMGQAVEPMVYGHATGLSPVAVIVVAIFWSWLWGPIGLILSTPLTLCLVVLGRHVENLEFLDILLGDRPPLTPIESFYQRLLAGDEDQVLRQAELLLRNRALSSYYDDIVLPGLQLAAADVGRGALSPERAGRINDAVKALVHDLDDHDDGAAGGGGHPDELVAGLARADREVPTTPTPGTAPADRAARPPAWRAEQPVLCVAGRGALDEATSTMLAQLLGKHGIGARVVPHAAVTRGGLQGVDTDGVALVCVSCLGLAAAGSSTRLRQVVRRLRLQLPDATVTVGLWPDPAVAVDDALLRRDVGSDAYVASLTDAVNQCLRLMATAQAEAATAA